MRELMLVTCLALAGCETLAGLTTTATSAGSYVSPEITGTEAVAVAKDMAGFLASRFPYAKTTIALEPLKTEFHEALAQELGRRGFGVADGVPAKGSVELHYAISVFGNGIVARMRFQGKEASRYYAITDKGLALGGRYALRGAFQ